MKNNYMERIEYLEEQLKSLRKTLSDTPKKVDPCSQNEPETIKYKHFRDSLGYLMATLCIVTNTNREAGIGLSICSDYDNFSRPKGREIALQRARVALISKRNTLPISIRIECINICCALGNADLVSIIQFPFKSIYRKERNDENNM